MNLISLQLTTSDDFESNLSKLIELIYIQPTNSFIVAPELCLNGYAYDRLEDAVSITNKALIELERVSIDKTISLTMTTKDGENYLNTLFIFHEGKIVHTQSKNKLFVLNDERVYFTAGNEDDIKIVKVGDLKVACLICFELRFIDLWKKIQGADLVIIPSMWGSLRKQNFETLTRALAVMNQCFVIASDSANDDMAKSSGIISPFGDEYRDDSKEVLTKELDLKEIKKMRRYMQVGIN
ncbi:MAG: carbon-nitrogen hydrolase family protein [Campylobacterota bacterium]|nr:carbon-nitrogen hydrolase family protein [Campylobacterota bacterium]